MTAGINWRVFHTGNRTLSRRDINDEWGKWIRKTQSFGPHRHYAPERMHREPPNVTSLNILHPFQRDEKMSNNTLLNNWYDFIQIVVHQHVWLWITKALAGHASSQFCIADGHLIDIYVHRRDENLRQGTTRQPTTDKEGFAFFSHFLHRLLMACWF